MRRFFALLLVIASCVPSHAGPLDDAYGAWQALRNPDVTQIRFADALRFLDAHPGWPEEKLIRQRAEAAALLEIPPSTIMTKFCASYPPISGRGMIACTGAVAGSPKQRSEWLHKGWIEGDFNADEEARILATYGKVLTSADHLLRIERLLFDRRADAATRMLARIPADKRRVHQVHIELLGNSSKTPKLIAKLTAAEQRTPGILFERLRFRANRGMEDDLAELLLLAPKSPPYADAWWDMRATAVRAALAKRNHGLALKLLANVGELTGENLADALWLRGWIALRRTANANTAYQDFFKLYTSVTTPVSKARAAYWAGRAAEKNGNKDIAKQWMEKAATRSTVFYGQLAQQWLKPGKPLVLPSILKPGDAKTNHFDADERVRMMKALDYAGEEKIRDQFINAFARNTTDAEKLSLLARLSRKLGGIAAGVEVAKLALRNSIVLIDTGWPLIDLPKKLRIENALALAITRQESEFNPTAQSSAGARGLMQLLPSTAKQVAERLDMRFRPSDLDDSTTNITLGSHYLGQLISGFDGSYVLAAAGYNAGPANVRKWLKAYGPLPSTRDGTLDWIESIPFAETRNYVMRVLENVSVYRTILDPKAPLMLEQDLTR